MVTYTKVSKSGIAFTYNFGYPYRGAVLEYGMCFDFAGFEIDDTAKMKTNVCAIKLPTHLEIKTAAEKIHCTYEYTQRLMIDGRKDTIVNGVFGRYQ